jgi:hypothetical protein
MDIGKCHISHNICHNVCMKWFYLHSGRAHRVVSPLTNIFVRITDPNDNLLGIINNFLTFILFLIVAFIFKY